jgi:hypothetical protein
MRMIRLVSSTRKHRGVVLYSTDITRVIRPVFNRSLEYDPLVVALALTLRLDAVGASRAFFSAFDVRQPVFVLLRILLLADVPGKLPVGETSPAPAGGEVICPLSMVPGYEEV